MWRKITTFAKIIYHQHKDMEFTAKQISEFVQGHVEGNENATVHTFAKIEEGVEGAISFLSNRKYTH